MGKFSVRKLGVVGDGCGKGVGDGWGGRGCDVIIDAGLLC